MCGLAGFICFNGFEPTEAVSALSQMTAALVHRGPDDGGVWFDVEAGVALGHRRLAILDLSPAGHQPMISPSGRFVLAFNGEIYNHLELRAELEPHSWRGHSDTETLLAAIDRWGVKRTLERAVGMFALALWDRADRTLFLARDRMGEKPLYYGWQSRTFYFASELKALRAHPAFQAEIDRTAVGLYVRNGYVPGPFSIYRDVRKLVQGTILRVTYPRGQTNMQLEPFWSLPDVIRSRRNRLFPGNENEAVDELERLLRHSVRAQQISDVPVGAFLSGGTDSSTVVALMQLQASRPVKTFTIGVEEGEYNEAHHAKAVATHLGTEHTELYVTPRDAMSVIPELAEIYDEPFADISQIPTLLVSRLARGAVTVVLSGDGGDELFCGYDRYPNTESRWRKLAMLPSPFRRALASVLPDSSAAGALACNSIEEFYRFTNRQWKGFPKLVASNVEMPNFQAGPEELSESCELMMYADSLGYLPDDILVKLDRAAMSVSLETRIPLLDHRVIEFAWSLPLDIKFRAGVTKWPLKELLYRYVPRELLERPKRGFAVPMHEWLRGPLRDWAESLLSEERLRRDGFFSPAAVRSEWVRHVRGTRDRQYGLWTILMFNAWLEKAIQPSPSTAVSTTPGASASVSFGS